MRTYLFVFWGALLSVGPLFSGLAFAQKNPVQVFLKRDLPKNMGCGPGAVIFQRESFVSSALGTVVNSVSSPLLPSSTTSGTSGCSGGPKSLVEHQPAFHFFAGNYDVLLEEIARGGGEHLRAFSGLLIDGKEDSDAFAAALKTRFFQLFADRERSRESKYLDIESNFREWL